MDVASLSIDLTMLPHFSEDEFFVFCFRRGVEGTSSILLFLCFLAVVVVAVAAVKMVGAC
jgi:hypothetical protein